MNLNEETFEALAAMEAAGMILTGGNKKPQYDAWKATQQSAKIAHSPIFFTPMEVEQMMNELVGVNQEGKITTKIKTVSMVRNELRLEQRQLIPSIIKKYTAGDRE